jgi:hypothetical protein
LLGSSIIAHYKFDEASGTSAADISGRVNTATYANSPTLGGAGVGMIPGTNGYASVPTSMFNSNLGEFTACCFANLSSTAWNNGLANYLFYFVGADNNNRIIAPKLSADGRLSFSYIAGGTNITIFSSAVKHTNRLHLALSVSKSNNRMRIFVNGIPSLYSTGLGTFSGTMSGYARVGNNAGTGWSNNIHDFMLINREITYAEARTLAGYDAPSNVLVGCDGDSRTSTKSWVQSIYPTVLTKYGFSGIQEWGVSGQTVGNMITNGAANIDSKLISGGSNILVVWGGVNDSLEGGMTASTIYTRLQTYCQARRAAGWNKIIVCSEIDAQDASRNAVGWHGTMYPALNALLRANYSFADRLADLGADARLQDATNTTYFNADKVHPAEGGCDVIASIIQTQISSL